MSKASAEIPRNPKPRRILDIGSHIGYVFDTSAEKQTKLFSLTREIVDARTSTLVYVAGKQGVKGIRLSLKDTGFDVAFYERNKQLQIADSEEWFTTSGRQQQFKSISDIELQMKNKLKDALDSGFSYLSVISETDMLVRKGFLSKYREFDEFLASNIERLGCAFICAFDRRELVAAGISDVNAEVSLLHSGLI